MKIKSLLSITFACITAIPAAFSAEHTNATLAGTWHINPTRSAELSPWQDYDLTITVNGNQVSIARELGMGRRHFAETMTLDSSKASNEVPIEMWPDNRNIGATVGPHHTKKVSLTWLDDGRILRLSTDLMLETQQGTRPMNILSDFKLSSNGEFLTLTELRSTRNRPVIYVFNRAGSAADLASKKTP